MNRTKARECAMKLVYEWKMGGDGGADTIANLLEVVDGEPESDYMDQLVEGVKLNETALNELIAQNLNAGWRLERIATVDHCILLIAAYEMLYTPLKHSFAINEAIELAHKFSTDKSGAFINGVLGSISRSSSNA